MVSVCVCVFWREYNKLTHGKRDKKLNGTFDAVHLVGNGKNKEMSHVVATNIQLNRNLWNSKSKFLRIVSVLVFWWWIKCFFRVFVVVVVVFKNVLNYVTHSIRMPNICERKKIILDERELKVKTKKNKKKRAQFKLILNNSSQFGHIVLVGGSVVRVRL